MYWAGTASGASGALSKDEDCPAAQVGGAIASLTFGRVWVWVCERRVAVSQQLDPKVNESFAQRPGLDLWEVSFSTLSTPGHGGLGLPVPGEACINIQLSTLI